MREMYLYTAEEIGICRECGKECDRYGYEAYSSEREYAHQECLDAAAKVALKKRAIKGVAVFNKYVPDWREKLRENRPYRAPAILDILFGNWDYAKDHIPELGRRCSAGRSRGGGSMRAVENAFFYEIGLSLNSDEAESYDLLLEVWMEAMDDPSLENIFPPHPRAYFHSSDNGGVCCRWDGKERGEKIGFPEKFGPQPKDGE